MELILSITGASGVCYGIKLLETLSSNKDIEIHLIISDNAKKLLEFETTYKLDEVIKLAKEYYDNSDVSAIIASGSKVIECMVIVPCSMSTAAKINTGVADNLTTRSADVCLKEGRRLIIVPRETPLNSTHLKNLLGLSEKGVSVIPAMPAFYHKPKTIDDQIDFIIGKILDHLNIEHDLYTRWSGGK
jgi:4-hydroxy-3-polyprenylbenzoate decarboxylase